MKSYKNKLGAFFNYLEKDGYLIASPAHNIKPKKVRKEKIDYFTIGQERKKQRDYSMFIVVKS